MDSRCSTCGSRRCHAAGATSAPASGSHSLISSPSRRCRTTSTSVPPTCSRTGLTSPRSATTDAVSRPRCSGSSRSVSAAPSTSAPSSAAAFSDALTTVRSGSVSASEHAVRLDRPGDPDRLVSAVQQGLIGLPGRRRGTHARGPYGARSGRDVPGRPDDRHQRLHLQQVDDQPDGSVVLRAHDPGRDAGAGGRAGGAGDLPGAAGVEERRRGQVERQQRRRPGQRRLHRPLELGCGDEVELSVDREDQESVRRHGSDLERHPRAFPWVDCAGTSLEAPVPRSCPDHADGSDRPPAGGRRQCPVHPRAVPAGARAPAHRPGRHRRGHPGAERGLRERRPARRPARRLRGPRRHRRRPAAGSRSPTRARASTRRS